MTRLLTGKTAIVAGADLALGAAVARAFLAHGANVVAGGTRDFAAPEGARRMRLDPRAPSDWRRATDLARAEFGGLTTLVCTVADPGRPNVEDTDEAQWDATLDSDLRGTWLGMKACVPAIRASGGGAIVVTASTAAAVGTGHSAAYHAAMAGVLMLARTAALEYAGENIRVNAVLPGPVDPSLAADLDAATRARLVAATPLGRLAHADEIAGAYVFLASDLAAFVTGIGLVVDGGHTAA